MTVDAFKRFVIQLPQNTNFGATTGIHLIRIACIFSATKDGEYLHRLFDEDEARTWGLLTDYDKLLEYVESVPFPNFSDMKVSKNYSHPPHKTCSRLLKENEMVYRCAECGYDDSCVLCSYCFNPDDHVGHDVLMYTSRGQNGGLCDCGDAEAFKDLHCKTQIDRASNGADSSMQDDSELLEEDFKTSLKETIRFCLDYILEVSNSNVCMLRAIHDYIRGDSYLMKKISDDSNLPTTFGGVEDTNSEQYHLILWNDENHDFNETEDIIMKALGCNAEEASKFANDINREGQKIMRTSTKIDQLIESQNILETIGLVSTIMSARDYVRIQIIHEMFSWFSEIIGSGGSFSEETKSILAELLVEPEFRFAKDFEPLNCIPHDERDKFVDELPKICFENGLLMGGGQFPEEGLVKVKHRQNNIYRWSRIPDVLVPKNERKYELFNSRVQYLMLFEIRFDKVIRGIIASILSPTLISDQATKSQFSEQLIQIYPNLLTSFAIADREEHLNFLSDITSQVLTCPICIKILLNRSDSLANILGPLIAIISEHSSKMNLEKGYPQYLDITDPRTMHFGAVKRAVDRGLRDFSYFLDKKTLDQNDLTKIFNEDNVILIFLLLRFYQENWPIKRKYGDHVESFSYHVYLHVQNTMSILNIVKLVATALGSISSGVRNRVIEFLVSQAALVILPMVSGVVEYRVSKDETSFTIPINSLISYSLQGSNFNTDIIDFLDNKLGNPFVKISDYSLRNIVLAAQIKSGFWVRNGTSASIYASFYKDSKMTDESYFRDLHMNQIACVIDEPTTTLLNFLDRWELSDWFSATYGENKAKSTIYEERFSSIVEEFVSFLYILLTDRSNFYNMGDIDEINLIKLKSSISYALVKGPIAYSSLKKEMSFTPYTESKFDNLLKEVSNYQPPTGFTDTGMYRLKSECFQDLDSISLSLDASDFQEVSEILLKNRLNTKVEVFFPKFIECGNDFVNSKIGRFSKTKEFAKLIYKLLQTSLDMEDETYLLQLLHLTHAVILDDERLHGHSYLTPAFINIPICNLLLTLVDSSMSKIIVKKSEYLLDVLIEKDEGIIESLTSCFGTTRVDKYIGKKSGKSQPGKKKKRAEKTKAKIMGNFAKQREAFLANNMDGDNDAANQDQHPNEVSSENSETDLRYCVVCGEYEDKDNLFGLFANLNKQQFWDLPSCDDELAIIPLQNWDNQSTRKEPNEYGKGLFCGTARRKNHLQFDDDFMDSPVITSCGHGIHLDCSDPSSAATFFATNVKTTPCPICSVDYSIIIPSFITLKGKGAYPLEKLDSPPLMEEYDQITHSLGKMKSHLLVRYCGGMLSADRNVNGGYSSREYDIIASAYVNSKIKNHIFKFRKLLGNTDSEFFDLHALLSVTVGDTIRMHEVASRVDEGESYSKFLADFPVDSKAILRAIMVCMASSYADKVRNNNLAQSIERYWDIHDGTNLSSVFTEVILLFFQTDESFLTLSRLGLTKAFTLTTYSLLMRLSKSKKWFDVLKSVNVPLKIPADTIDCFRNLVHVHFPVVYGFETEEFLSKLYYAVERCLLPLLRQLIIFKDILTSNYVEEKVWISIEELNNLEEDILNQEYIDSSKVLLQKLNLPSLDGLIKGLSKEDSESGQDHAFEKLIFDVLINFKIPKLSDRGIMSIPYPGVVKLIELPENFISCVTKAAVSDKSSNFSDFKVCLVCGMPETIRMGYVEKHYRKCTSPMLFFHPRENIIEVYSKIDGFHGSPPLVFKFPGPYLTEHGEVYKKSGKATLNASRYKHLTKLWLNQGITALSYRWLRQRTRLVAEGIDNIADDFNLFNNETESDDDDDFNVFNNEPESDDESDDDDIE